MRLRALAAALGLAAGVPVLAGGPAEYPDAPPPGTTGGFGEPTCASCHLPASDPGPPPTLVVRGVPEAYVAGAEHELTVELAAPDLARAGFMLSARYASGPDSARQAGVLSAAGPLVAVTEAAGIAYAHHAADGTAPAGDGRARWTVRWRAPAKATGPVAFHAVGNAANGDESALGDRVVAVEATTTPAPRGSGRSQYIDSPHTAGEASGLTAPLTRIRPFLLRYRR